MAGTRDERGVHLLRQQAERAIAESRGRLVIEPLLTAILERATREPSEVDEDTRIFAHRHLASLMLERDPWRAALHLRKVLAAAAHDDGAHALMALSQALLGNHRAAIAAYRRAIHIAPRNPWYRHNLGHLLDIALDDPVAALPHLEVAAERAGHEHEVLASLAHCLARLGQLARATMVAEYALDLAPDHQEHQRLLGWILRGAPEGEPPPVTAGPRPTPAESTEPAADPVWALLARSLPDAGFTPAQVEGARLLWCDYQDAKPRLRIKNAGGYAAAVHYAVAGLNARAIIQATAATLYNVKRGTVSSRYTDMRTALGLRSRDPRYARST